MTSFDEIPFGSDAQRRKALDELHDKHIQVALKEIDIKLAKLDQAEAAILEGSQTQPIDPNTVLTVKRNLEAIKGKVQPLIYDSVEKIVLCDMVLGEPTIKPENKVQAALDYVRAHPSRYVHTAMEMVEGTAKASEEGKKEGAKVQKVVDDAVLEQKITELTSFDARLKVLQEWKDAGVPVGWGWLKEMGFMDFLAWKAAGSPRAPQARSSSPTIQNRPRIVIALGAPGLIRNGGSSHTGFVMSPCTPPIKVHLLGPPGIECTSALKIPPPQGEKIEGILTFVLTSFVSPGEYETTIKVTDSVGRTGLTTYRLTVLEGAAPTVQSRHHLQEP